MSAILVPLLPSVGALASLVVGALFAGADTALTSLSATHLQALIDQAKGADKRAYERIRDQEAELRSRYLLGRVSSTVVTAICMLEVFEPLVTENAGWVALAATVLVTSVTFEVSTTLARKHADDAAAWAARWMRPLEWRCSRWRCPSAGSARARRGEAASRPPIPG